jgi:hypothetical protein
VRVPAAAADTTGAAESDSSAALERFDLEADAGDEHLGAERLSPAIAGRSEPSRRDFP